MNEIIEIGNAQDLILGGKDVNGSDTAQEPFRRPIVESEEDE